MARSTSPLRILLALALTAFISAPMAHAQDPTEAPEPTEPAAEVDAGEAHGEDDAGAPHADVTEAGEVEGAGDTATTDAQAEDAGPGPADAEAAPAGDAEAAPDAGDAEPTANEGAPPTEGGAATGAVVDDGPHAPMNELMPSADELAPQDLDGDGSIDPEEQPIVFDVPDGLRGADFIAAFKALVEQQRDKIIAKMVYKTTQKQSQTMGLMMWIMLGLTGAGLLLLLAPLFLRKKYPGREALLRKGAVLATLAYVSTMLVFTGAIWLLRTAKNETAMIVNPPLAIADSSFDAIQDQIDFMTSVPGGEEDVRFLLEPPIAAIAAGTEDGMLEAVLANVAEFKNDLGVFKALADFFKSLSWLFASMSTLLVIIAVVMFLLSQKTLLRDILRLPAQAAAGDVGSFGGVYAAMQKRAGREVLALLLTIGVLLAAAFFAGFVLFMALGPAVSALFDYVIANVIYVLTPGDLSKTVVYLSLFGYGLFLGLVVLLILLGNAFFLGKLQKVLQQSFRHPIPAGTHTRFYLWGPLSALWIQVLPVGILFGSSYILDAMMQSRGDISWETALLAGPLGQLGALLVLFWALQGFRAMKYLRKYDHLAGSPEQKPST